MKLAALVSVFTCLAQTSANLDLLLLHTNDMHARFEETSRISGTCFGRDCVGGFARVAHIVRRARQLAAEGRGRNVLFLNAGDTYTGTAWFGVFKWKIVADFLNLLNPDVACLGNHEFDMQPSGLYPFLEAAKFPIATANVKFPPEFNPANTTFTKSSVLNISGVKIGVIGYLTPATREISSTGNVIITDEIEAIKEESERLDRAGINIIIALGHSGHLKDVEIAEKLPLVDLVVGGHTNTFLWNGPQPDLEVPDGPYPEVVKQPSGKKVPVVQAYAFTKYIGQLNVTFNDKGDLIAFSGQPLLLDTNIAQEQDVLDRLEIYRPEIIKINQLSVGKTKVVLDGDPSRCRKTECNFGNLIVDSFVAYGSSMYNGPYWTDAPIALYNGGAIRNSIIKGNITRGELLGCMPFDNQVIVASLTGEDLRRTLEIGARSNGDTSGGEFLQVSGLQVVYDFQKPTGSRVVSVKARCSDCDIPHYADVELDKNYRVVTVGFLINGGDSHYVLRNNTFDKIVADLHEIDVLVSYLERVSPIYTEIGGRIETDGQQQKQQGNSTSLGAKTFISINFVFVLLFVLLHVS